MLTFLSRQTSYADRIPDCVISHLLQIFNKRCEGMDDLQKIFMIQYSYFVKNGEDWICKNLVDIGNESVSLIDLKISENFTSIYVYGKNENYGKLFIDKLLDTRKKSRETFIYAPDLYLDFEPLHFIGKCYTSPVELNLLKIEK